MTFCFKCGAEVLEKSTFCDVCGEQISSAEGQVSVSLFSRSQKTQSKIDAKARYAYLPVAVFQAGQPVTDELEKTVMTTIAFRKIAEPIFKKQVSLFLAGTFVALFFALIAFVISYALFVVSVFGLLLIVYGLFLRPEAELHLSKAYCSLASVPFGEHQLVFDLNGCIGLEQFEYTDTPIGDISSKIRELPEELSIENENLLIEKLREIAITACKGQKTSVSTPLAAKGHAVATCIKSATSFLVVGKPNNEIPRSIELDDCLRHAELLKTLEAESTYIVTFIEKSITQCLGTTDLFAKRLEKNQNTVTSYFDGFMKSVDERLFGGVDYQKRKDDDVSDFVAYNVSKVPDFANIVRPFQTVIDSIFEPIQVEIHKSKQEFDSEKSRLLRDLDHELERTNTDTERELRQLRLKVQTDRQQVAERRSKRNSVRTQLRAEERKQMRREPSSRNWSHARSLEKQLNGLEKDLRTAEVTVTKTEQTMNEAISAAKREKARLEKETKERIDGSQQVLDDKIRKFKEPIIDLEKERDHIIDMRKDLLTSLKLEEEMQRRPYLERYQKLVRLRDEATSRLREQAEIRSRLINKIGNMKIDLTFKHPIEIGIPFWILEVKYKNEIQKWWFAAQDIASPAEAAKSWIRDFANFSNPKAPFSSCVAYLESHDLKAKDTRSLSSEELRYAAKRAELFVENGILSPRCYTKMLDFFGEPK